MREMLNDCMSKINKLISQNKSPIDIINTLKNDGFSLSVTVVGMNKSGISLTQIEGLLSESTAWKDESIDLGNLFYEYIQLDDDLITE